MTLSFDPDTVTLPQGHFIGGQYVQPGGSAGLDMHRPSDGQLFASCPIADAGLVDEAVRAAQAALRSSDWARGRPRDRARVLNALADLILAEAPYLGQVEALSSSRPITQVMSVDIPMLAEVIRFFAEMADKEGGALVPTADDHLGMIMDEPYGVVGAIAPWNFPLIMAAWKLAPALAAGNAVVFKPSEMTPHSALVLAEMAVRAGVPAGILNVVLGDGLTTGAAITGHRDIAKISFTGSTRAGQAIMENIARHGVKPMTLELGGKSPQLVFADADLDLAADCVARNIIGNAGQVCVAGSRLLVHDAVAPALTQAITARMQAVVPGPTWDAGSSYSPIISARQIDRISAIVGDSRTAGATLLTGGRAFDHQGYFYRPTLITDVEATNPAVTEEIFGPVLTVQTFADEDQAATLASHPLYGLAVGIYTRDLSRSLRLARQMQAGTVWINRYGRSWDHILPTGGFKGSGIGKDLGRAAYHANRRQKSVLIALQSATD
ncbi:MAG TPA: aldehyde dehydrogenase family protein [Paenirhodobacter sp.]